MYRISTIFAFLLLGLFSCQSPQKKSTADQSNKKIEKVTKADLDSAIHKYLAKQTNNGADYYNFQNDTINAQLKLLKVHAEHLSLKADSDLFSIGVAMINSKADLYDLDFYFRGRPGDMKIVNTDLHKLNSKACYVWKQDSAGAWFTIKEDKASEQLLGILRDTNNYIFNYKVTIPKLYDSAQIWVPIAQTGKFQNVEIQSIAAPGNHKIIKDSKYGNKALYIELSPEDSGKTIDIKYKVKHWEKLPYTDTDSDINTYLASTPLLPLGGKFERIDRTVFKEKHATTPLSKARALYDYIIKHMRYNKQTKFGTGSADYACDMLTGNCTEFHSFFISLCRTADIPARFFVGASISSTKDEGSMGYHCWAEFYAEGKWWPVDISEAYKYDALADYYFGHNPANRFQISRGRDIVFKNGPKSGAINYFIYPVLEVDGNRIKAPSNFSFKRIKSVS